MVKKLLLLALFFSFTSLVYADWKYNNPYTGKPDYYEKGGTNLINQTVNTTSSPTFSTLTIGNAITVGNATTNLTYSNATSNLTITSPITIPNLPKLILQGMDSEIKLISADGRDNEFSFYNQSQFRADMRANEAYMRFLTANTTRYIAFGTDLTERFKIMGDGTIYAITNLSVGNSSKGPPQNGLAVRGRSCFGEMSSCLNTITIKNSDYIAWRNETDTGEQVGITTNNQNDLTFYVGAANRLYINHTTGNVGIGTTSPSGKLNVDATSGNILNLTNAGVSKFYVDSSGNYIGVNGARTLNINLDVDAGGRITTNGGIALSFGSGKTTTDMTILTNGNVGIGTTTPNATLEVLGNATVTNNLTVSGTTNSTDLILPTTIPATVVTGKTWFNTTSRNFDIYNGTGWNSVQLAGHNITTVSAAPLTIQGQDITFNYNATDFNLTDGMFAVNHSILGGGSANDTVYGTGWDGSTGEVPSQNAVYDKIQTLSSGSGLTHPQVMSRVSIGE